MPPTITNGWGSPPMGNRHQRRFEAAALKRAGYFDHRNGIAHSELTNNAYELLKRTLEERGNILSASHLASLMALVGLMTDMAKGDLQGRWAFGLPTGMGKTSAVIAWIVALAHLQIDHISIAVASSKVEELCRMKRELLESGVPANKIGLRHSYHYDPSGNRIGDGWASEPSTGDDDRQFMLVTHSRVRDGSKLSHFSHYHGKPRDLLIYDESLIVSDSVGLPIRELRGAVGYLEGYYKTSEEHQPAIAYLRECQQAIETKLADVSEGPKENRQPHHDIITLPQLDATSRAVYRGLLGGLDTARSLLEIGEQPIRVIPTGDGGVVTYSLAVPPELKNIIILDASYPIRRLIHLDKTISDAEGLPQIRRLGGLAGLKRFDDVTIHQMYQGGGRSTLTKDFTQNTKDSQKTIREIADAIKGIPEDEGVLIFTYKDRHDIKFRRTLLNGLVMAGINTLATLLVGNEERPRINILTWGQETGTSEYAWCRNVILAGILHRSLVDLTAAHLGQTDNLAGPYSSEGISQLLRSECSHFAYQALSRGSCRTIDNGQALPMKAWIIHRDGGLRVELEKVMPGVQWKVWNNQHGDPSTGAIAKTAAKIAEYLSGLPPKVASVSSRQLKVGAGLSDIPKRTFSHAALQAQDFVPWEKDRAGFRRLFPT